MSEHLEHVVRELDELNMKSEAFRLEQHEGMRRIFEDCAIWGREFYVKALPTFMAAQENPGSGELPSWNFLLEGPRLAELPQRNILDLVPLQSTILPSSLQPAEIEWANQAHLYVVARNNHDRDGQNSAINALTILSRTGNTRQNLERNIWYIVPYLYENTQPGTLIRKWLVYTALSFCHTPRFPRRLENMCEEFRMDVMYTLCNGHGDAIEEEVKTHGPMARFEFCATFHAHPNREDCSEPEGWAFWPDLDA